MTRTILRSRFPQIILELPARGDAAAKLIAERIEQAAKRRAPDRPPIGEGLVDAIHTERQGVGTYAVIAGDDDVFYGHLVENGTVHSAPHPFLVPALEESRDVAQAVALEAFRGL